jgi:hypothetical protein
MNRVSQQRLKKWHMAIMRELHKMGAKNARLKHQTAFKKKTVQNLPVQ